MTNKLIVFLLLLTSALALTCVYQSRRLARSERIAADLSRELAQLEHPPRELRTQAVPIDRPRQESTVRSLPVPQKESRSSDFDVPIAPASAISGQANEETNHPSPPVGFANILTKMMEDPDMKKFVRDQQKVVMEQLYGPLVKQLNLNPEEAEKFKTLLADDAMKGAEKATSIFADGNSTNRTEVFGAITAEHKAFEGRLKELLGEANFAEYQNYQQTAGDRMQLNAFKQQTGDDIALTDPQTEALLVLMKEEKQKMAASGQPLPGASSESTSLAVLGSADQTEAILQGQEGVNQRVFERAKSVLGPDQLTAFAKFQTNQLQMMRMGMAMARKFFPSAGPQAPPALQP